MQKGDFLPVFSRILTGLPPKAHQPCRFSPKWPRGPHGPYARKPRADGRSGGADRGCGWSPQAADRTPLSLPARAFRPKLCRYQRYWHWPKPDVLPRSHRRAGLHNAWRASPQRCSWRHSAPHRLPSGRPSWGPCPRMRRRHAARSRRRCQQWSCARSGRNPPAGRRSQTVRSGWQKSWCFRPSGWRARSPWWPFRSHRRGSARATPPGRAGWRSPPHPRGQDGRPHIRS